MRSEELSKSFRRPETVKNAAFDAVGRIIFGARLAGALVLSQIEAHSNKSAVEALVIPGIEAADFHDFYTERREEIFQNRKEALINHTVERGLGSQAFIEEIRQKIED